MYVWAECAVKKQKRTGGASGAARAPITSNRLKRGGGAGRVTKPYENLCFTRNKKQDWLRPVSRIVDLGAKWSVPKKYLSSFKTRMPEF